MKKSELIEIAEAKGITVRKSWNRDKIREVIAAEEAKNPDAKMTVTTDEPSLIESMQPSDYDADEVRELKVKYPLPTEPKWGGEIQEADKDRIEVLDPILRQRLETQRGSTEKQCLLRAKA